MRTKKQAPAPPPFKRWDEEPNGYLLKVQKKYGGFWDARGFPEPSCGNHYVPVLRIEKEDYIYTLEQKPWGYAITVNVTDAHDKKVADLDIICISNKIKVNSSNMPQEDLNRLLEFLGADPKVAESITAT
jgi:hypothetical protein